MEAIERMLRKFIALNPNQILHGILKLKGIQDFIINLNRQQQLYEQGVDAHGDSLGEYAGTTIDFKRDFAAALGRDNRFDHITLKDTGAFYKTFVIRLGNDYFEIDAQTKIHDVDLISEFGDILGLTDENLELLIDVLKRQIVPIVLEKLLGK